MSKPTPAQRRIKSLIRFYERRGWDWISACGFECVQAMKAASLPKKKGTK